jgi:hypothetical protein
MQTTKVNATILRSSLPLEVIVYYDGRSGMKSQVHGC